jgi:CRISPR/Cas system-associated exonuclease Cas4 (RecB family)
MKTINTLVDDIYSLFDPKTTVVPKEEDLEAFAHNVKTKLVEKLSEARERGTLRMSAVGKCARMQWYSVNQPEKAEKLRPETYIKFLYGDVLEQFVLFLAKTAGHTVTHEQEKLKLEGISGSLDAIIDDVPIDVKSAATRSMLKFRDGITRDNKGDDFGYWHQLGSYVTSLDTRDTSTESAFVAIDKQHGHLVVSPVVYTKEDKDAIRKRIQYLREVVSRSEPPSREYTDEEYGKSGNRGLCTACSYCQFKRTCWPGLRTFIYSTGPEHLTIVKRLPNVPEAK